MTAIPHTFERWRLQWQQRPRRERRFIVALAMAVALTAVWLGIWLPLKHDLEQRQRELPFARAQLELAQRQFSESAGLSRQTVTPANADPQTAIQHTAARFNIASAIVTLDVQPRNVSMTFSAISFDTLVQWLETLQHEEHFYITAATLTPLTASEDGHTGRPLRAELVLARPAL